MEVAIKVGEEVWEIEIEISERETHGLYEESEGEGG
jgi:hypothetical protein